LIENGDIKAPLKNLRKCMEDLIWDPWLKSTGLPTIERDWSYLRIDKLTIY
jgi:hypothetical protein